MCLSLFDRLGSSLKTALTRNEADETDEAQEPEEPEEPDRRDRRDRSYKSKDFIRLDSLFSATRKIFSLAQ